MERKNKNRFHLAQGLNLDSREAFTTAVGVVPIDLADFDVSKTLFLK
jgi:hypothetical protein